MKDSQQVAFAVFEPGPAVLADLGDACRLVGAGKVILFELHATLLEIAHLSVGVGVGETTCRFEPDNAINLPRRSTGSAQLSVVGQATGKPGTFRYARFQPWFDLGPCRYRSAVRVHRKAAVRDRIGLSSSGPWAVVPRLPCGLLDGRCPASACGRAYAPANSPVTTVQASVWETLLLGTDPSTGPQLCGRGKCWSPGASP